MSATTKTFFGLIFFFLFPQLVVAASISPQTIDMAMEPGESASFTITIKNNAPVMKNYMVKFFSVNPGSGPDDLSFQTIPSGIRIKKNYISETTEVPSEAVRDLSLQLLVDEAFDPGVEVIAVQIYEVAQADDRVAISTGMMTLVFLTIGEVEESAEVLNFSVSDSIASHLPIGVNVALRNTGESVVQPVGSVKIENIFGRDVEHFELNSEKKRIPSGQDRSFSVYWGDRNDIVNKGVGFFYELRQEVEGFRVGIYEVRFWIASSSNGEIFADNVRVVLFPWRTSIVFFGILLVLAGGTWITRKK